jgi:hypothetical protein
MGLTELQLLIVGGIALWILILTLVARASGWAALAAVYRLPESFDGQRWHFQTAQMRWATNYGNCLTVGASPRGLYLAILFPFRPGHPALLVPWADISVSMRQRAWFTTAEFQFRRVPGIPLRISARLAARLATAAGPWWPGERLAVERP